MSYQAGDTYPLAVTVRDADGALADPEERTLAVRLGDGTLMPALDAEALLQHPSVGRFTADIPLVLPGMYVIAFTATEPDQYAAVSVWVDAALSVTFCTPQDVATRLGRDLTAAETPQVEMLFELVSRSMPNPASFASTTETLGAYSYTQRYRDSSGGGGLLLTDAEARMVRRAVYGRSSATTMPTGTLTQSLELVSDGEIVSGITE